jgi:hypothetical protein
MYRSDRASSLPARLHHRSVSRRRGSLDDEYLYRCMRGDGNDVVSCPGQNLPDRERSPERFAYHVLMAIGHGSRSTSPFLHTSRDFQIAQKWKNLG